jgi:ribose/xylose/arabinose/galactoside ABC-type transport system permease subunit
MTIAPPSTKPPSAIFAILRGLAICALPALVYALLMFVNPPVYSSHANLQNVSFLVALIGVLTLGQVLLLSGGHIDVSVSGQLAVIGPVTAMVFNLIGYSTENSMLAAVLAVVAAVLVGVVFGLLYGLLCGLLKLPSFPVTLIFGLGLTPLAYSLLNGQPISLGELPATFRTLQWLIGAGVLAVALVVVAGIVLIGVNRKHPQARSGMWPGVLGRVRYSAGLTIAAFLINGIFVGLASAGTVFRLGAAVPTGSGYFLDSVDAAAIGGVGSWLGAVGGAAIVALLVNAFAILGVTSDLQQIALLVVLLLAVVWAIILAVLGKSKPLPSDGDAYTEYQQRPVRNWVMRYQVIFAWAYLLLASVFTYLLYLARSLDSLSGLLRFAGYPFTIGVPAILAVLLIALSFIGGKARAGAVAPAAGEYVPEPTQQLPPVMAPLPAPTPAPMPDTLFRGPGDVQLPPQPVPEPITQPIPATPPEPQPIPAPDPTPVAAPPESSPIPAQDPTPTPPEAPAPARPDEASAPAAVSAGESISEVFGAVSTREAPQLPAPPQVSPAPQASAPPPPPPPA